MNAYQILETYLPEMTEIRKGYNQFINDNKILKSEDDKLFDYFLLVRHAYQKHDFNYCFGKPDFNILLDYPKNYKTINVVLDAVNTLLAHKLRYREMNDKINGFSSVVLKELEVLPNKEGYDINHQDYWTWKQFPPFDKTMEFRHLGKKFVRYALNVKPNVGIFKKLDAVCDKNGALAYKVASQNGYNYRKDPIIIYGIADDKENMLSDLSAFVPLYKRGDVYDMLGYENLNNGVYFAEEIRPENMLSLMNDIATPEEKGVYTQPLEDDFEQIEREFDFEKNLKKQNTLRGTLLHLLYRNRYNPEISAAQFQAYKMMVALCHAKQKTLPVNKRAVVEANSGYEL